MYSEWYPNGSFAYTELIRRARGNGSYVKPRGEGSLELTDVQIAIRNPAELIAVDGRELKYEIGALEACSLVGQFHVPEEFTHRIKKFKDFERNGVQWGAYGPRIAGDLGQLVDLLKQDGDTRQAVLTIFDSRRDLNRGEPDIPCTIAVQFLQRGGQLQMRTMMRSNDLWLGFPYDLIQFFALHAAVAQAVGVPIGRYVHNVGSLHLYERDIIKSRKVYYNPSKKDVFKAPYWSADNIGDISAIAREILIAGRPGETDFEEWLSEQLH